MTIHDAPAPASAGLQSALRRNIEELERRRAADRRQARWPDRVADAITCFAGSMAFVAIHLVLYGAWIAVNLGWVPDVRAFDTSFVILAMEASVEAIFLSTFVLISQNRMQAAADKRSDLDLHINLLAEHELTKLAELVARIADRLGVEGHAAPEFEEVKRDVQPEVVLDAIEEQRD